MTAMKKIMRFEIIKSFVKKEFKQLLRDMRMRGVLFGAPLMMIIIFGNAVNTDVNDINLAVLDEDKTSMSREVMERFTGSDYFLIHSYLASESEIEPAVSSRDVDAVLRFKTGFSKTVKDGNEGSLQVLIDGSNSIRASVILSYVNEIIGSLSQELYGKRIQLTMVQMMADQNQNIQTAYRPAIATNQVVLKERYFFNPELKSRNFYLPGVIGLLIGLITTMLTSMSIVKERETGTIEQIIVSPLNPMEYILGKTIPYAIIGLVDMLIVSLVAIFWFNVPFRGSIVFLILAGFLFILSTLSVGLYISTISKTQQQAMLSFFLFFMPAILLSGFAFPIYPMPETIQFLTYLNPLRYFMTIIRGVFLKGTSMYELWQEIIPLFLMGVTLLYLSSRRFSRGFE